MEGVATHLKQMVGAPETPKTITKKLSTLQQTEGLDSFCTKLQQLTQELENCYLDRKIPADEAKKMALDAAIDTSRQNIKNKDLRQILKAGNFNSLRELTAKIEENKDLEKEDPTTRVNIFQANRSQNDFATSRGRNNWRFNERRFLSQTNEPNFPQNNWSRRTNWNRNRGNDRNRPQGYQRNQRSQNPRGFQNHQGQRVYQNRNIYTIEGSPQESETELQPQLNQQYASSASLGFIPGQSTR